jgi:hypothetical protein
VEGGKAAEQSEASQVRREEPINNRFEEHFQARADRLTPG